MPLDLNSEIKKGQIVVLIIPNEEYTQKIVDVAKYFADNYKATCYTSLNKLYDALTNSLKEVKVDISKFLFIDAITKSANPNAQEAPNSIFVSSSSALTELSIAINKALDSGQIEGFLFDSLSTLLIYNKSDVVCKFVHTIINKIKASNTTAIFTALEGDTQSALLKEIGMFVDKVIHYK